MATENEAVLAEREACAMAAQKLADNGWGGTVETIRAAYAVAKVIRSRGKSQSVLSEKAITSRARESLANMVKELRKRERFIKACDFYATSPTSQYDEEAVVATEMFFELFVALRKAQEFLGMLGYGLAEINDAVANTETLMKSLEK